MLITLAIIDLGRLIIHMDMRTVPRPGNVRVSDNNASTIPSGTGLSLSPHSLQGRVTRWYHQDRRTAVTVAPLTRSTSATVDIYLPLYVLILKAIH